MTKNEFLNAYKSMRRKLRFSRRIRHPITSPKTLIGIRYMKDRSKEGNES